MKFTGKKLMAHNFCTKNLSGLNTGIYRIEFIFNNNGNVSKQLIIK